MTEYIFSVLSMAIIFGIAVLICPDSAGIKKHIKLICSLCLLCVMISPMTSFINNVREFSEKLKNSMTENQGDERELYDKYNDIYKKYLEGGYGNDIGKAVKDALYKKFSIPKENIRTMIEFSYEDENQIKQVEKITVILSNKSVFEDPEKIVNFISELFKSPCVVAIE